MWAATEDRVYFVHGSAHLAVAVRTGKSPLVLEVEHIRLLTPVDLRQVVGGEAPTKESAGCTVQSTKRDGSCELG